MPPLPASIKQRSRGFAAHFDFPEFASTPWHSTTLSETDCGPPSVRSRPYVLMARRSGQSTPQRSSPSTACRNRRELNSLQPPSSCDQPRLAGLIELVFTIVSETLISATLTDVARGERVNPAVTDTVRDHAVDEGRHHAYFASYLKFLWATSDTGERDFIARLFPKLIDVFLDPDRPSIAAELASYRMPNDKIQQVLADVFSEELCHAYNKATSSKLLTYLQELDVFENAAAYDAAAELELLG